MTYIEKEDVLPPIVVLQTLSKNPCLTLSVVKDYIARKLEQESKLIEDDRKSMNKYQVSNSIVTSAAFSLCSVAILSTFYSIYAKELVLRIAWFGANVI